MNKTIALILFTHFTTACSAIGARESNGIGHPYISSEESLNSVVMYNGLALAFFFPALVITLPATTIDLAASITIDTIALPADLICEPDSEHRLIKNFDLH